jgi:hypothetical protein
MEMPECATQNKKRHAFSTNTNNKVVILCPAVTVMTDSKPLTQCIPVLHLHNRHGNL